MSTACTIPPLPAELAALPAELLVNHFLQHELPDGFWYWNLLTPSRGWVNATFWRTLGYRPDQVPPDPAAWYGLLHPADLVAARHAAALCEQDATRPFDQVLRATHQSGAVVWLRCQGLLLRDAAGAATWLAGALRDITQEKQEQVYAQEIATHYSQILSNESVYIVKTDNQGNYLYANDFFYERFGYGRDILGTQSLLSIIEEDRAKCLAVVMQCFAQPEVRHQVILRKTASKTLSGLTTGNCGGCSTSTARCTRFCAWATT